MARILSLPSVEIFFSRLIPSLSSSSPFFSLCSSNSSRLSENSYSPSTNTLTLPGFLTCCLIAVIFISATEILNMLPQYRQNHQPKAHSVFPSIEYSHEPNIWGFAEVFCSVAHRKRVQRTTRYPVKPQVMLRHIHIHRLNNTP